MVDLLPLLDERDRLPTALDRLQWTTLLYDLHETNRDNGLVRDKTVTVLGTFAAYESIAIGFRQGLRFLSMMMLTLGLTAALLMWRAARGLHAPPGAGYT
ncbi:MAG TPA: hypothetical protein VMG10_05735 [Gemmataceae bacterium]|nr:hypothetical protein [Gemmataceae bacterium]